jgi:DNA-binding transcriptional MerR regulator
MNISEVAARYQLTPATLRYYEQQGLIPPIARTKAGNRTYSNEDVNWIEFIKCMRDSGLSIESLAEYTKLYQKGDETLEARQAILIVEYKKLLEKQQQINETVFKLGNKIKNYEAKIKTGECQTASYANGSVEVYVSLSEQ